MHHNTTKLQIGYGDENLCIQTHCQHPIPHIDVESLAKDFNITSYGQWYSISRHISSPFSRDLLSKALVVAYPDVAWQPWRFDPQPPGLWNDKSLVENYLDWLASSLNLSCPDSWHGVLPAQVKELYGGHLLRIHGGIYKALRYYYPEYPWQAWKFGETEGVDMKDVLKQLAKKLKLKKLDDWYQVTREKLQEILSWQPLERHGGIVHLLQQYDPAKKWQPWKFRCLPSDYWDNEQNVMDYLHWVSKELKMTQLDDWYGIFPEQLQEMYGQPLLQKHKDLATIVSHYFPTRRWHLRRFGAGFWRVDSNVKAYLRWLSNKLGISQPSDWYNVTRQQVLDVVNPGLIKEFGSIVNLLKSQYPDFAWQDWKLKHLFWKHKTKTNDETPWDHRVVDGFWDDFDNVVLYMKWVSEKLNIISMEDWYKVQPEQLKLLHGKQLLRKYGGMVKLLTSAYPEYHWQLWRFSRVPDNFWDTEENIHEYMKWLSVQVNITCMDDWYNVVPDQIRKYHGTSLLTKVGGLVKLLMKAFPDYCWYPWKFRQVPDGFWEEDDNLRWYMDSLSKKLEIKELDDWYNVPKASLVDNHGSYVLQKFGGLYGVLAKVYDRHPWRPWKFKQIPELLWEDDLQVLSYLEWLAVEQKVHSLADWYRISNERVEDLYGNALLQKYGGLVPILAASFPELHWDLTHDVPSKAQELLVKAVTSMLPPDTPVWTNYNHPKLLYTKTASPMQFDIYLPTHCIAIEYQGQQHYQSHYFWGTLESQQRKDREKRYACNSHDITLIEIPYWWDGSLPSLEVTLHKHAPSVFPLDPKNRASPIKFVP